MGALVFERGVDISDKLWHTPAASVIKDLWSYYGALSYISSKAIGCIPVEGERTSTFDEGFYLVCRSGGKLDVVWVEQYDNKRTVLKPVYGNPDLNEVIVKLNKLAALASFFALEYESAWRRSSLTAYRVIERLRGGGVRLVVNEREREIVYEAIPIVVELEKLAGMSLILNDEKAKEYKSPFIDALLKIHSCVAGGACLNGVDSKWVWKKYSVNYWEFAWTDVVKIDKDTEVEIKINVDVKRGFCNELSFKVYLYVYRNGKLLPVHVSLIVDTVHSIFSECRGYSPEFYFSVGLLPVSVVGVDHEAFKILHNIGSFDDDALESFMRVARNLPGMLNKTGNPVLAAISSIISKHR